MINLTIDYVKHFFAVGMNRPLAIYDNGNRIGEIRCGQTTELTLPSDHATATLAFILACVIAPIAAAADFFPYFDGGKWGYCDADGILHIKPQYSYAEPFRNGIAVVKRKNCYGIIIGMREYRLPHIEEIRFFSRDWRRYVGTASGDLSTIKTMSS